MTVTFSSEPNEVRTYHTNEPAAKVGEVGDLRLSADRMRSPTEYPASALRGQAQEPTLRAPTDRTQPREVALSAASFESDVEGVTNNRNSALNQPFQLPMIAVIELDDISGRPLTDASGGSLAQQFDQVVAWYASLTTDD